MNVSVQAKRERYAPSKVAERVGDRLTSSVRGVGETVRDVIDEGRAGMREREAELHAELESPRPRQRLHRRAFTKHTKRENPKGKGTADVGLLQPRDALDHR